MPPLVLRIRLLASLLLGLSLVECSAKLGSPAAQQQTLQHHHDSHNSDAVHQNRPYHAFFESAEHQLLGDSVTLHLPNGTIITGDKFNFKVGKSGSVLTFGEIVTLGDFYSSQRDVGPCQPQISDPGLTDQKRADIFQSIVTRLVDSSTDGVLNCLLDVIKSERSALAQSQDPAQRYADGLKSIVGWIGGWDWDFYHCTSAYLGIALCNPDHFGDDAITAYTVGHTVALQHAKEAKTDSELLDAYFYEAFAQHYLSDLFSAGHLRAPRRILHVNPSGLALDYPADACNRYMHDEDSANGLWVNNLAGDSWPMFGDKQIGASKSNRNRELAIRAMQNGLDELLRVFHGNQTISVQEYDALKLIPRLSLADQYQNFAPLFSFNQSANTVQRREHVSNRRDSNTFSWDYSSLHSSSSAWIPVKGTVSGEGIISHMYPRTIQGYPYDFNSDVNITQIRPVNSSHILINQYGPVWTRSFGSVPNQDFQRSWNMKGQDVIPIGLNVADGPVEWLWSELVSNETIVIAGSNQKQSFLTGVERDKSGKLVVVWTALANNSAAVCHKPSQPYHAFGMFSNGPRYAYIQYCEPVDGKGAPFFQVWMAPSSTAVGQPAYFSSFEVLATPNRHTYTVFDATTQSQILVDIAYNPSNSSNLWTFKRWSEEYSKEETEYYWEPSSTSSPIATYILDSTDPSVPRLLRLTLADSEHYARISVISLAFGSVSIATNDFDGGILPQGCNTQSWHFMDGIEQPDKTSLVNYCRVNTNDIIISTFTYTPSTSTPLSLVSKSSIPAFYAPLFNWEFLRHITTQTVELWNATTQQRYQPPQYGFVELFDNYGILGARLVALNLEQSSNVEWMPIGQYPAIAGQVSDGLTGQRDGEGFMFDWK